ncbi:MAG: vitamin B12-dependent ribonucleotide reductase [Oscillospiraceae bacterium]|nr:vitamin B12-dependent ribonucleotide reductase [Oscillospiraceae bacterium]
MNLSPSALEVLTRRYLARDERGEALEDAEGLFRRVADSIAGGDAATAGSFYEMMTSLDFLPNSPTLMNAGRPLGQLSACFVLPVDDSLGDIFEAVKQAALIHQSGGGTGFAFTRLRPRGAGVRTTGGVASGPVSFMKVFNAATEAIKQGGTRRGANMGVLRVDHPDILEFIDCKRDTSVITNFNISVALTDEFMDAAASGKNYRLLDPRSGAAAGELSARDVFSRIVDAAWHSGEPGILFIDRINAARPAPGLGLIEATNPCGEQPLLPYESCNLGSINLSNMVCAGPEGGVDWDRLEHTARLAVRFLDNVIEVNRYPLGLIREKTLETRKIGLGVMGFADMLFKLRLRYDSNEAVELGRRLMAFIKQAGVRESQLLASERGAFPACGKDEFDVPRRNATITTIAPTGTLSMIAGVSSGIEPVFALSYTRRVMDGTELREFNPVAAEFMREHGAASPGELPDDIKNILVTAHDITPEWHVRMQAAFQRHTDNAVSKTVNFPAEASRADVEKVYMLAYELGCKGVTIYRDGSRGGQVLTRDEKPKAGEEPGCDECALPPVITPRPRPQVTRGVTERIQIGCGNLYITVNFDERGICEVFTNTGKNGGCPSQSEATARLATAAFRAGVDPAYIIKQLKGIRCPATIRRDSSKVTSCPDAIAKVIERMLKSAGGVSVPASGPASPETEPLCPECGHTVTHEGGCVICRGCGYSKCG